MLVTLSLAICLPPKTTNNSPLRGESRVKEPLNVSKRGSSGAISGVPGDPVEAVFWELSVKSFSLAIHFT